MNYINQSTSEDNLEEIVNYQLEHWAKDHDRKFSPGLALWQELRDLLRGQGRPVLK